MGVSVKPGEPDNVVIFDGDVATPREVTRSLAKIRARATLVEDVEKLEETVGAVKRQIDELQASAVQDKDVNRILSRVQEIEDSVDSVGEISRSLTADVVLPPQGDLRIRLVPSDSLDRLEEYRADQSVSLLFVGIFLGAILGILSNWITDLDFTITRISGAFMVLFLVMASLVGFWTYVVRRRASETRKRMLFSPLAEEGSGQEDHKIESKTAEPAAEADD